MERAIVVGVGLKSESLGEIKENLLELEELVGAAGGEVVGTAVQLVSQYNPATLIGSGKVKEISDMVKESGASLVVIDHKLTGVQARNLEQQSHARIVDRNQVILDIFAQRAQTYEGKLQVELAQLLDQMPRMVDAWMGSLSRQGGGIGARGPGEKALEIDRRRLREKVSKIKRQLNEVRKKRGRHRWARRKNKIPSFALIGYTNTGKSTLLNQITKSDVMTKDQVFATLDPTTRRVFLPNLPNAVITDTVGFIRKLPPQLIEAFKATLEESAEADVLLHVIDIAAERREAQIETVNTLIREFEWNDKPIIHVFNKTDLATPEQQFSVKEFPRVFVSALTGEGIDRLRKVMEETALEIREVVEMFVPKHEEHLVFEIARDTKIQKKEAGPNGTYLEVQLSPQMMTKWSRFAIED